MYKKIFSSLAVSVFIKLISFIASVVIARSLGAEGRGELAIILAVYGVAVLIGNFGFVDSFLVFLKERKKDVSGSMLFVWSYSLIVGGLVGILAIIYIMNTQPNKELHIVMLIYALSCPVAIFTALLLNIAIIMDETKFFNISRAVQGVLYVIFVLLFSLYNLSVRLVIVSLLLSLVIATCYLYYVLKNKYKETLRLKGNRGDLLVYLKGCGKLSISNFLVTLTYGFSSQLPVFYLSAFSNLNTVGVYSVSFNLITLGVSLIIPSMAIITAANNDGFSVGKLLLLTCSLSIIGVALSHYTADTFFILLYGSAFSSAGQVFTFLVPYAFFLISAQILSAILRGKGHAFLAAMSCIAAFSISLIFISICTTFSVDNITTINASLTIYSVLAVIFQMIVIIFIKREWQNSKPLNIRESKK